MLDRQRKTARTSSEFNFVDVFHVPHRYRERERRIRGEGRRKLSLISAKNFDIA